MTVELTSAVLRSNKREQALRELFAEIPAPQQEMAERKRLPAEIVELLREAGIYRMLVAKRFGGDEASPAEFLRVIERIATVDASTGWGASFGFSAIYLSSLPVESLEKMYANKPDVIFAGASSPRSRLPGVYRMMGTDGIFADSNVGRYLQDALIVPQHAFLSEGTYENAGKSLLGLETGPGYP